MMRSLIHKYISIFMVIVIFAISVAGFCRDAHAAELSDDVHCDHDSSYLSPIEKQCPSCPGNGPSESNHCDSSCYCSCNVSLTVQPVLVSYSPLIAFLVFPEPFEALPEVYLSKFIPPHILV